MTFSADPNYLDGISQNQLMELWADLHENLGLVAQHKREWNQAAFHLRKTLFYYGQKDELSNRELAQCELKLCNLFLESEQPDSCLYHAQSALRHLFPKLMLDEGIYPNPPLDAIYAEHTLSTIFKYKIKGFKAKFDKDTIDTTPLQRCLENCDFLFLSEEYLRNEYNFEGNLFYRQAQTREYFEIAIWAAHKLWSKTKNPAMLRLGFQYAEQARERVLSDALEEEIKGFEENSGEIQNQLEVMKIELAKLEVQRYNESQMGLSTYRLDSIIFEKHLERERIKTSIKSEKKIEAPQTDLSALLDMLLPDQALLEYFLGDTSLYVFVLTKNDQYFIRLSRPNTLENTIDHLIEAVTDSRSFQFGKSADSLYKCLLKKPLPLLPPTVQYLLIVPDGRLGHIPFEVLGEVEGRVEFHTFPYLIRRLTVGYTSSCRSFLAQNRSAKIPNRNLKPFVGFVPEYVGTVANNQPESVKNIIYTRDSFRNIPGAIEEVEYIDSLLNGDAFYGEFATEQRFKMLANRYKILHLAMHGVVNEHDPRFSRLFFTRETGNAEEDGVLHAIELATMRLSAEMAVLSACQTGMGQVRRGEGIISLSRAFALTGVQTTILTLWSVSDAQTKEIMIHFYTNLIKGARKDEALRAAKLFYLNNEKYSKDASPFYWAGIIGLGNQSPLFAN